MGNGWGGVGWGAVGWGGVCTVKNILESKICSLMVVRVLGSSCSAKQLHLFFF